MRVVKSVSCPARAFCLTKMDFSPRCRFNDFFYSYSIRTPYDKKHLDGWRGMEHWLVTHPTASHRALNGDSTRYRDIGGTRPVFD